MSDLADLPRPSLASECTESLASRPLDGASAGGMPVGRVELAPSPPPDGYTVAAVACVLFKGNRWRPRCGARLLPR